MITKEAYQELAISVKDLKPTNLEGASELSIQLIWLSLGFYLSTFPNFLWFIGQTVLGIGFWRSFAILHACGHGAFFRNRIANDVAGILLSPFCLIPYHAWKFIHQDHHVWTGWIDLDPTTKGLLKRPTSWQLKVLNFCWKAWIPLVSIHYIFTMFFSFKAGRNKGLITLSILWVIGFYVVTATTLQGEMVRYFGLSFFIYLNLGDISLLTQHVHLPLDHSQNREVAPKALWEQDHYSHTMILPDLAERWMAMGFNRHALHHLFPRLPYYKKYSINFEGTHTHNWREWIVKAKGMKASELIYN